MIMDKFQKFLQSTSCKIKLCPFIQPHGKSNLFSNYWILYIQMHIRMDYRQLIDRPHSQKWLTHKQHSVTATAAKYFCRRQIYQYVSDFETIRKRLQSAF